MNTFLELARRFDQIGLRQSDVQNIPPERLSDLLKGRLLLVIVRKPHCPHCGETTFSACSGPKTQLPLEKLFPAP